MRTILVPSPPIDPAFVRDPKDIVFLSTAIATGADFLITGDRDLLCVTMTASTRIISAADFASVFHIT